MGAKYQVQNGDTLWGLAERFYGDGRLFRVISVVNDISDPDHIVVGQELEVPYVTLRYQVRPGDTKKKLALTFYNDVAMSEVYEIPNGAAQRDTLRLGDRGSEHHSRANTARGRPQCEC